MRAMSKFLDWRPLPWLLVGALVLWCSYGIWPIVPVEGDELGVVNGLEAWRRGSGDFDRAGYLYPIQPGSYLVLRALGAVGGGGYLTWFGGLSVVGALAFAVGAARLLADVLEQRFAWVLAGLLTLQECTAAASYANTSALANAVAMAGLCCAWWAHSRRGLMLAGALLAVAGWLRADSLLVAPAVLGLRGMKSDWRTAVRETAEVALVSGVFAVFLFRVSGVGVGELLAQYRARPNTAAPDLLALYGWLPLGYTATIAAGVALLAALVRRAWGVFGLSVLGFAVPLAVYQGNFASPKYLHVALAFLALPVGWMLGRLIARARTSWFTGAVAGAMVLVHLSEGWFGVQTSHVSVRRFSPAPLMAECDLSRLARRNLRVGVGEGEILLPSDGPRLRGGFLWAPRVWRRLKQEMAEEQALLAKVLPEGPAPRILTCTYLSYRMVDGWLRAAGYREGEPTFLYRADSWVSRWSGPRGTVELFMINIDHDDRLRLPDLVRDGTEALFLNDIGAVGFSQLVGNATEEARWQRQSPRTDALVTLYRRPARR